MKRQNTIFLFLILSIIILVSFSNNPPNGNTGAPGDNLCTQCHTPTNPPQNGNVQISGLPSTIDANMTYSITVTSNVTTGVANRAGFQLVALDESNTNAGSMTSGASNPAISMSGGRTYAEHNPAILYNGGNSVNWTFDWTAPSGPNGEEIKMYAASVLANGANGNSGDRVVTTIASGILDAPVDPLVLNLVSTTNVTCFGLDDGEAEVEASGGVSPYTYAWSNGSSGSSVNNLTAGSHTVTVTDDDGSTESLELNISEPSDLVGVAQNIEPVTCFGANDGSADINASGGVSPYTYLWSNGQTGSSQNNLSGGNYTVTITDSNLCGEIIQFTIDEPDEISIDEANITMVDCNGNPSGAIDLTISGGVGDLQVVWSNGQSGPSISNLIADDHFVTITDNNNCEIVDVFTVTEPPVLTLSTSSTPISSAGANDGTATVIVSGGSPPYSYLWSNGATTSMITNLSPGTYVVLVTDNNGCLMEDIVEIFAIDCDLNVVLEGINPICNGSADGSINSIVTGGVGIITYNWSNGLTEPDITSLVAGTYSLTVSDEDGCEVNQSINLENPPPLLASVSNIMNIECEDDLDGSATVTPASGIPPFTFLWENGSTDSINNNLGFGINLVTITDANSCTLVKEVNIAAIDLSLPSVLVNNTSIYLDESGLATLTVDQVDGGSSDNCGIDTMFLSQSAFNCEELGENLVSLTVQDINGLLNNATAIIQVLDSIPPQISCPDDIETNSCENIFYDLPNAIDNCAIDSIVLIQGFPSGTPFPGGTTEVIWQAIDQSGNTSTCSFEVTVTSGLEITLDTIANPTCFGLNDGYIGVNVNGGNPPYDIMWSLGATELHIFDLTAGDYEVVIIDAMGCVATQSFMLEDPDQVNILIDSVYHDLNDQGIGKIEISVNGGTPPYDYSWILNGSQISKQEDPDSLQMGTYQLIVTDSLNCSAIIEVEVSNVNGFSPIQTERKLTCSPNPARSMLTISGFESNSGKVYIFNKSGQEIKQIAVDHKLINIDIGDLQTGLYIAVYHGLSGIQTSKFIKL